ncbi:hypothetical protein JCM19046_3386 [Bacillus sp. JCM 19046]|nr:hypothetical protein JCM19045_884 [Bacillus sp. JCM 19045]GAF18789.1 hypothetical protein JCM19046_3386 [Bacillus sp. JCM 19046]
MLTSQKVLSFFGEKAEEMGKQIIPFKSQKVQSEIFSLQRTIQQFENLPKESEQSAAEDWLNRDSEVFKKRE